MNRLTNKKLVDLKDGEFLSLSKEEYCKQVHEAPTYKEIYTKLGKFEDLEDKLGCPLEIISEALKEGIVDDCDVFYRPIEISLGVQLYQGELVFVLRNFDQQTAVMCANIGLNYFPDFWLLKDHGKTWRVKGDKENAT